MRSVNIQEAKTHLSRLLEDAANGEDIVIAKAGRPFVRLVPCSRDDTPRRLGAWAGKVEIAPDFDRASDEVLALFEGDSKKPKRKRTARSRTRR
jgi:prevent-host-death family protein